MGEQNDLKNETIVNIEGKQNVEKMKETIKNERQMNKFLKKMNKIYFYALIVSIVVILTLIGFFIDQSLKNNKQLCDNCGTNKDQSQLQLQLQTENKEFLTLFYHIFLFFFTVHFSFFSFFFCFVVFFYFQITKFYKN